MPHTNSWLCIYAIAQLGKPYVFGAHGHFEKSTKQKYKQKNFTTSSDFYDNPYYGKSVKVHDCAGLVLGAMMCDTVDGKPTGSEPIYGGATSQYNYNCKSKSTSMSNFPKKPGTLVFHDASGTKTHVGIYVGTFVDLNGDKHENTVVEAQGSDWGVVYSSISAAKWNAWGQLTKCDIDTSETTVFDARTLNATGLIGNVQLNIETRNMYPFVATIPQGSNPKLEYGKIKDARISAMMFFGGELYDDIHIEKRSYVNPYLENQVHHCDNAGLPYALYVNVRAKTDIEADLECRTLYYIVSRYSPKLGLWLSLKFNNSKAQNDKIIEIYYKYFEQWGLSARCGLYVTPSQLDKISWDNFQDRFYLWMIQPMKVDTIDDELLQPEMFEVPD